MATFSRGAVKLVVTAGSIPAAMGLGTLRTVHADAGEKLEDGGKSKKTIVRACDLPLYDHTENERVSPPSEKYPRNSVEENIGVARKNIFEMVTTFMDQCETIVDKVSIGVEHTKASLEFVQTNPGHFPRVAVICVAGMGGVVLGYRGGVLRKMVYSSIAVGSSAALCYPKTTVELSQAVAEDASTIWQDIGGKDLVSKLWPFSPKQTEEKSPSLPPTLPTPQLASDVNTKQVKKDEGQSNPKDKDLYSTRGS